MIYLSYINKTKFLTVLAFVVIFSALALFCSTKAYAAPNNQGLGWAMAIGKQSSSNTCMGTSDGEIVRVFLTSSEDHSARPTANIRLQNAAAPASSIEDSNVNSLELACIDPNSGVWVQVWGNSSYLRWDTAWSGEQFNWGMGFKSGEPSDDEGKIVSYYIFLVPNNNAASIEAIYPQPDNAVIEIPDTDTTADVNFQVRSIRGLPSAGGSNIEKAFIWLNKTDGGNLPGCSSSTCFYEVNNGSWGFGSTISIPVNNLPVGRYEWYSQLLEDKRRYCSWGCLDNTYPITAQFANQNFVIKKASEPPPPPPPPSGNSTLMVYVFNDINGDGIYNATSEDTLLQTEAPATIVRLDAVDGPLLTIYDTESLVYKNSLPPDTYKVYFKPDSNWVITRYSNKECNSSGCDSDYSDYDYRTDSGGYYHTNSVETGSGFTSRVRLGVKRQDKPNLTADTAQIDNGVSTFVRTSDPVPVSGIIKNIGIAKDLPNIGVGFYLNDGTIDQTNLRNYTRAATTTTSLTTSTTQSLVSSEVSVSGLSYGSHTLWICADYPQTIVESNETDNCATTTFTLAEPQDQWLQTQRGDVGVRGNISLGYHPVGVNNADYLVVTQNALVNNFHTAKNWLVRSYTPLNVYPTASASYVSLRALYSKSGISSLAGSSMSDVSNLATPIGQTAGDLAINWTGTYTGNPRTIFVNGNLTIQNNLQIGSGTGLIFIVSGNITIATLVIRADGIFISYGTFNTTSYTTSCSIPLTETHSKLQIHGAVYSFGQSCFTRNLGKLNNGDPAELIIYEPKYLLLFRNALGQTVASFQEISP